MATPMAFCRTATDGGSAVTGGDKGEDISRDLPARIVLSIAFAKSVKTVSTSLSPASTAIMSALGLVYRLARTPPRKTVKVCFVSSTENCIRMKVKSLPQGLLGQKEQALASLG